MDISGNQEIHFGWVFFIVWLTLTVTATSAYLLGKRSKQKNNHPFSEHISSSIMGLLSLILGFSFSLAISRYENRRALIVDEANSISTAYLRSTLLKTSYPEILRNLYISYINARIKAYETGEDEPDLKYQNLIWENLKTHTKLEEDSVVDSTYIYAITQMFDAASARNFALYKNLPIAIYVVILLMSLIAVATVYYDRGFREETNHLKANILLIFIALMFSMIYDIDHPKRGLIYISQDAMIHLRDNL